MNKEKPLSEKRKELFREYLHPMEEGCEREFLRQVFDDIERQDKQAVKRLKDAATFISEKDNKLWIDFDEIDKIFGSFE